MPSHPEYFTPPSSASRYAGPAPPPKQRAARLHRDNGARFHAVDVQLVAQAMGGDPTPRPRGGRPWQARAARPAARRKKPVARRGPQPRVARALKLAWRRQSPRTGACWRARSASARPACSKGLGPKARRQPAQPFCGVCGLPGPCHHVRGARCSPVAFASSAAPGSPRPPAMWLRSRQSALFPTRARAACPALERLASPCSRWLGSNECAATR